MSRRASAERRAVEPTPEEQKPRLELIEGGKRKEEREKEPSWSQRAGAELKMMDALAKEVKGLEKKILAAETAEARADLVEALEEIEGKLREARSEWKQIVADVPFPEPSTDVAGVLREIREMEAEPKVVVATEYKEEVEKAGEKIVAPAEKLWEEPRAGWEKDAKTAANELKDSEPPGMNLLAFEMLEKNELPPRMEREIEHEARKLEKEAARADWEVAKLEQQLERYGVNPDKLATSAAARFALSFRMFWNGKLDNLMMRYRETLDRADRARAEAQIAELAPRDPMRSVAANAELIRKYANRRTSRQRSDAAYARLVQRGSRLG